ELRQPGEVLEAPRVEPCLAASERALPAIDVVLEPVRGALAGLDRRRSEPASQLLVGVEDQRQVLLGPWLMRMPAVDVLQAESDPASVVEYPPQLRNGHASGHGAQDTRLAAV